MTVSSNTVVDTTPVEEAIGVDDIMEVDVNELEGHQGYSTILYAQEGIGKTSIVKSKKPETRVGIIDMDKGTTVLKGQENVKTYQVRKDLKNLKPIVDYIVENQNNYDVVVIDTFTIAASRIFELLEKKHSGSKNKFEIWMEFNNTLIKLFERLLALRESGIHVIFLFQEEYAEIGDDDYQYNPAVRDKVRPYMCAAVDVVARMVISRAEETKGDRMLICQSMPHSKAKSRLTEESVVKSSINNLFGGRTEL